MFVSIRLAVAAAAIAGIAALVAVINGSAAGFVLVGGNVMLLAALAYDIRTAPDPQRLGIDRRAPGVTSAGRKSDIVLTANNPTQQDVTAWVRDATPPSFVRIPDRHVVQLARGGRAELASEAHPTRRGRHALGPISVRTLGPLGTGGRQRSLPVHGSTKVYPALPSRAEVELRLDRARLLQVGERSSNVRGGGTEFDSLREYHQDDEFRRINWRATARSAKAISNQFREEKNQQVMLMLDAGRMMAASIGGVSRFEHAIDAAMAIAELANRVGDQVGMTAFGSDVEVMVGPRGGRSQPRRILDALFELQPTFDASDYRAAFARLLSRHRKRSLLVLLTELTEESAIESLFQAVPALVARHLVIVGAVQDPSLESLAGMTPASSEDVYLKAAASQTLDSRDRSAAKLRGMGVRVIDQPPRRLAGQLADSYLRIKALGRL